MTKSTLAIILAAALSSGVVLYFVRASRDDPSIEPYLTEGGSGTEEVRDEGELSGQETSELRAHPRLITDAQTVDTVEGDKDVAPDPFDEQMRSKYSGLSKQQLVKTSSEVRTLLNETKASIFEQKRAEGDYLERPTNPSGFVIRPPEIPNGLMYRSITNPEGRGKDEATGLPIVWHLHLERDLYADVYALSREWRWLHAEASK